MGVLGGIILLTFTEGFFPGKVNAEEKKTAGQDTSFFQRREVKFKTKGYRNPFNPLMRSTVKRGAELEEGGMPEEEDVTVSGIESYLLIGIIRTGEEILAILEGPNKETLTVKKGDNIARGIIKDIKVDHLVFHMERFGRTTENVLYLKAKPGEYSVTESRQTTVLRKPGVSVRYKKAKGVTGRFSSEDLELSMRTIRTLDEVWAGQEVGGEEISEVDSLGSFRLISPTSGEWKRIPFKLDWSDWKPGGIRYTLKIDTDPGFAQPILTIAGITSSQFVISTQVKLPVNTELYWRIIAEDDKSRTLLGEHDDWYFIIESP